MARTGHSVTILTSTGDVVPNAPIEIRLYSTGSLASIFEQNGTQITQLGATADANGIFRFWAEPDEYFARHGAVDVPVTVSVSPISLIEHNNLSSSHNNVVPRVSALEAGQQSGVLVFQTLGELSAYTPTSEQENGSFKVVNDVANPEFNGYYSWSAGNVYTKDAELNVIQTVDISNTTDGVSGSAVAFYNEMDFESTNAIDTSKSINDVFIPYNGTGGFNSNPGNRVTDFIPLSQGESMAVSGAFLQNPWGVYHYDEDRNWLGVTEYTGSVITGQPNSKYIRMTYDQSTPPMARRNSQIAGDIVPYSRRLKEDLSPHGSAFVKSKNLFDKSVTTKGFFVPVGGTGSLAANPNYEVTDFIPLTQGNNLVVQGGIELGLVFSVYSYDSSHNWISSHQETGNVITGVAGSAYIRVSLLTSDADTAQIESGTTPTSYIKYGDVLNPGYLTDGGTIDSLSEPVYGAQFLRETIKRLRALQMGFSDSLNIAFIGDSWTADPQWYSNLVTTRLKSVYGNAGAGWTGFSWWGTSGPLPDRIHGNIDRAKTQVSIDSNWDVLHIQTDSPDVSSTTSSVVGAQIVVTTTDEADAAYLFADSNGAEVRYRFNSGAWTNLTLNSGSNYPLSGVPSGAYTLTIEVVSGSPILHGVDMFMTGANGVVGHKLGAAGSKLSQWAPLSNDSKWRDNLSELAPSMVVVMLGTNDDIANGSISGFSSDMSALVANIKLSVPDADILLVMPPQNVGANSKVNARGYADVSLEIAKLESVGFISLQPFYGLDYDDYKSGSTRDWFDPDGFHPNYSGGSVVNANAILDIIGH
jgi:lysophospholipase L1-like esterase